MGTAWLGSEAVLAGVTDSRSLWDRGVGIMEAGVSQETGTRVGGLCVASGLACLSSTLTPLRRL